MRTLWSDAQLKRMLFLRLLEVASLVALVAGCFVGYSRVKAVEVLVEQERLKVASRPEYVLHVSALQTELRGRAADIDRVAALVADPEEIVQFIEDIENVARLHKVILEVSTIDEVAVFDEQDQPIEPQGPFRSIKLMINGQGSTEDLLEYLHKLEHGSPLVSLPAWAVAVDRRETAATGSALSAREIGQAAPEAPAGRPSTLQAEIILLVHNEKYSAQ